MTPDELIGELHDLSLVAFAHATTERQVDRADRERWLEAHQVLSLAEEELRRVFGIPDPEAPPRRSPEEVQELLAAALEKATGHIGRD